MPFVPALRKKLAALKEEFDSGLLTHTLYEDLCRQAINSFGTNLLEVDDATLHPKLNNPAIDDDEKILESLPKEEKEKSQRIVQKQIQQQQQRQQQQEEVKHNLGSHTSTLSVQSNADDRLYESNSNNLVTINVNNSMYDYDALNDGQNYQNLGLVNDDNNNNAKATTNNKNGNSTTKSKQDNNNANNNNGANELFDINLVDDYLTWKAVRRFQPGFINLGNSCYLNAAIQCLFAVPPFFQFFFFFCVFSNPDCARERGIYPYRVITEQAQSISPSAVTPLFGRRILWDVFNNVK